MALGGFEGIYRTSIAEGSITSRRSQSAYGLGIYS